MFFYCKIRRYIFSTTLQTLIKKNLHNPSHANTAIFFHELCSLRAIHSSTLSGEIGSFNHGCCIYAKVREGKAWYTKKFISRPASDRNLRWLRGPEHELELRECRKSLFSVLKAAPFRNMHEFKILRFSLLFWNKCKLSIN